MVIYVGDGERHTGMASDILLTFLNQEISEGSGSYLLSSVGLGEGLLLSRT